MAPSAFKSREDVAKQNLIRRAGQQFYAFSQLYPKPAAEMKAKYPDLGVKYEHSAAFLDASAAYVEEQRAKERAAKSKAKRLAREAGRARWHEAIAAGEKVSSPRPTIAENTIVPPALPFVVGGWVVSTSRKFSGKAQVKHLYPDGQVLLYQGDTRMVARREHLQSVVPDVPAAPLLLPAITYTGQQLLARQARRRRARALASFKTCRMGIVTIQLPAALQVTPIQVGDEVSPMYSEGYYYPVLSIEGHHLEIDKKTAFGKGKTNTRVSITSVSAFARRDGRIIRVR